MRDILFRGKRADNGEWVEGGLFVAVSIDEDGHRVEDCFIQTHPLMYGGTELTTNSYEVIPETVGQYTGLKDKNGKEIYEGDIVLATLKFFNINNEKCKVIFHNGSIGVQYGFSTDYFKTFPAWDEVEVIGNIHDNPELLGGDSND
jgi:uncharacterized phage protein (TIGR01671 family)